MPRDNRDCQFDHPKGGPVKRLVLIALVAIGLSACAGGPGQGSANCGEGMCVTMRAVEPIQYGQPVTVTITVTSDKDRSDLNVILYTDQVGYKDNLGVTVADPGAPEATAGPAYSWNFAAKANVPVRFTRVLRFPDRPANVSVHASLSAPSRSMFATDSIKVIMAPTGSAVYHAGTPIPGAAPRPTVPSVPQRNALGTIIPTITPIPWPTLTTRPTRVLSRTPILLPLPPPPTPLPLPMR
jgi:hypothetical protein